ncbi:MAG TPA: phospholipase D-like domain-containing protein [Steroidobacteraceae bacterium]|nr:phospholipase D-like domain-containing protein [Steroidobacteraceae bacterium]
MKAPWTRWSCAAIAVAWAAGALYYATRQLPAGMHLQSPAQSIAAGDVTFLHDLTGADAYAHGFSSHTIFDTMLRTIGEARSLVVLDCHLCTDLSRSAPDAVVTLTPMGAQLVQALLARKATLPGLQVLIIADPVNGLYGAAPPVQFQRLRAAGVQVVTADLTQLRDRNVLYSGPWRLAFKWWSHPHTGGGWLPNPYSDDGPPLTLRAWAQLANLKSANRRVLIADDGHDALLALVGTAQPAMAGSIDTVTALEVKGPAVAPLLMSELELARSFGWNRSLVLPAAAPAAASPLKIQWLGEGAIHDALLAHIGATGPADTIDIASESLSERATIAALLAASRRGVTVRLILDPHKSSSLRTSANQSVASELIAASDARIRVAWYRTHSERFSAALLLIHGAGPTWLLSGSASLTRRDLDDYDLAVDAALTGPASAAPLQSAQQFFDTLWNDRGPPGIEYTADADTWTDPSQLRYWAYRLMELLGVSRT